ncbi:MAG: TRAP transporter substrate-binding protein [Aquamicrobium sp.]|uniref:TRAP transporter substrate-binding protein n=1 Tax=Aquamicrobium sp. TaxID=1872579 RepID=UPI00349EEC57|nr:TRAP transporter substrate-binding protein [Aquamicrobium sp.]
MLKYLGCAAFAATMTVTTAYAEQWDLAAAYPASNPITAETIRFAEKVGEATGGELTIVVHPSASLLPLAQIKRGVQTGDIEAGEIILVALENEDPLYGLDNVPFVVTGIDDARKLWDASRPMLEERFAKQGMRLIYAAPWPPQGLYTPRPAEKVEDLAGLKFRSYGPSAARFGELLNLTVTNVAFAELSEALATGRVDAMMTSAQTGVDAHVWETPLKYFYDLQAWIPKSGVFVNEEAFQKLTPETQKTVLDLAAEAEAATWERVVTLSDETKKTLTEHGLTVAEPSAELAEGLRKVGLDLLAGWEERADEETRALLAPFK